MANIADDVIAIKATVDTLVGVVNGLVTQVAAIATPTVDLSTVAKADALAAVATQVADIDTKVTPTVVG